MLLKFLYILFCKAYNRMECKDYSKGLKNGHLIPISCTTESAILHRFHFFSISHIFPEISCGSFIFCYSHVICTKLHRIREDPQGGLCSLDP